MEGGKPERINVEGSGRETPTNQQGARGKKSPAIGWKGHRGEGVKNGDIVLREPCRHKQRRRGGLYTLHQKSQPHRHSKDGHTKGEREL